MTPSTPQPTEPIDPMAPDPTPPDDASEFVVELDLDSFNRAERMELQSRFDCDLADLWDYVAMKAKLNRKIDTATKIVDAEGNVRHADEILQVMVWVQLRRARPDVKLEDLDHLNWTSLVRSLYRRRPKASTSAGPSGKRTKTSTSPD